MKQLVGMPQNIKYPIMGRVTHKLVSKSKRKDYIRVVDKGEIEPGYLGIITRNAPGNFARTPLLYKVRDLEQLSDGDVISIEPTGIVNVLYQKESDDNSILVTERCDCACIMCPQPRVTVEEDKTELNLRLISLIDKDTKCLGITGGEPTLVGDKLIDIIATCKRRLPNTDLILLTNGISLSDFDYVRKLVLINHPALTIDVALYADTDTEHNRIIRANGFFKTIKGLYNLAWFEQKVGIRIVMHKLTYQRLYQLAEFIYHNFPFVFHIAFMQMETVGLAEENIEKLWIDPHDYNQQLQRAVLYLARREMNVSIYNAQLCVLPRTLWKYARKSISSWKNIYLDECDKCHYREVCGGLFASSSEKHSEYIKPL